MLQDLAGELDPSDDLGMVSIYQSPGVEAEFEADLIRGLLQSHGIPALLQRAVGYPSLGFEVRVPRIDLQAAGQLIEEAKAAGPQAALEASDQSETGHDR